MDLLAVFLSLVLLGLPAAPAGLNASYNLSFSLIRLEAAHPTTLIAHRGLSAAAPENTLPAIQLAAGYGMDGCEFDVFPTADGVWVLQHDATVDRMTDGTGTISQMTYAEISALTVDAGNNVELYPDLGVCTLSEALDLCAEADITPYIEIKGGNWSQLDDLVDLIRQKGLLERAVILSYGYDILQYLRTGGNVIDLYWLVSRVDDRAIDLAKALPNTGLDFWLSDEGNTPQAIARAQAERLPLIAWVADTQAAVNRLADMNVTQVTTNRIVPPLPLHGV